MNEKPPKSKWVLASGCGYSNDGVALRAPGRIYHVPHCNGSYNARANSVRFLSWRPVIDIATFSITRPLCGCEVAMLSSELWSLVRSHVGCGLGFSFSGFNTHLC
ncbi:hypothetical protein AVEN_205399-1 [Araneus ventricosus]|uniref:Uncharacterized protein n=1 Tax=Araneus ventricosus TaxID=182803 RepID=A0A4Y2J543_ARAVE|nr:hypothetical protein AVEN_205399-1 [Araneus ventricosus]